MANGTVLGLLRRVVVLAPAFATSQGSLVAQAPPPAQACRPLHADTGYVALTGLTLWDGTGRASEPAMTVLMKGERIAAVFREASQPLPAGTAVRDMHGLYAIPGLIDTHVHVATDPSAEDTRVRTERRLCRALLGGVTAVRDMAGDVRSLASLARDAQVGDIAAPDASYAALWAGPSFFADPRTALASAGAPPGSFPWMRAVDSTTNLPQAVAEARGTGASAIKLYADLPGPLVAAIVAEAHRQGLAVWAHAAIGPATPLEVVEAGVDVVSHATLLLRQLGREGSRALQAAPPREASVVLDGPVFDSLFVAMRSHGTIFEPTLFIYQAGDRSRMAGLAAEVTRRAHAAGVPIVAGTDSLGSADDGPWTAPNLHEELALLVSRGGLSPVQALQAATSTAARALGREGELGAIGPGMLADLVILSRDPTADIKNTRSPRWVVKRGAIYRGGGS